MQEQFSNLATGITVDNLNISKVETVKIPVPELPEQKKLVAKVKKLEQAIKQAQDIIEKAPKQKQQILDKYLK